MQSWLKTKIDKPTDNFCLILSPTIVTDKSPTYKNVSLACCQTACTKVQFGCLTLIWLYAFKINYVNFIDYIHFKEGDIAQPWSVISSCANGNSGIVPFSSFSTEWLSLIDIKKVIIWFIWIVSFMDDTVKKKLFYNNIKDIERPALWLFCSPSQLLAQDLSGNLAFSPKQESRANFLLKNDVYDIYANTQYVAVVQATSVSSNPHLQKFQTFQLSLLLSSNPHLLPLQRGNFSSPKALGHPLARVDPSHHQGLAFAATKVHSNGVKSKEGHGAGRGYCHQTKE